MVSFQQLTPSTVASRQIVDELARRAHRNSRIRNLWPLKFPHRKAGDDANAQFQNAVIPLPVQLKTSKTGWIRPVWRTTFLFRTRLRTNR